MHTLRHTLFATGLLLTLPSITIAAVPVEMRPLTPSPLSAATAAANASSSASGTAETPTDQTSVLWKLYQQVQDLQQEVRSLRGRFESQEQQLDATDKELKARFTDLDQRFDQFKNQQNIAAATPATSSTDNTTDAASGTNTSPTPTAGGTATSSAPNAASTDADKRAYVSAYDAYKAGGAAQAIGPMQAFIRQYPASVYVPNAHYWLGEFYLAVTPPDFKLAAQSFSVTSLTYPKSAKAAAATYRLATMADVDNRPADATRLMTRLVNDYAGTQEAGFAEAYLKTHRSKPATASTKQPATAVKPASSATNKPSTTTTSPTTKPKAVINNTKPTQLAPPLPSSSTNKASSNTKRTEPKAGAKDTVTTKTTSTSKNVQ